MNKKTKRWMLWILRRYPLIDENELTTYYSRLRREDHSNAKIRARWLKQYRLRAGASKKALAS